MLKDFTLLYVEDDADTQEYMEFYLADEVKEFYQAYNGEEGIEVYQAKKPDIIVTDLNMPKLNGIDMIQKIKAIDKEQIIIITSAFGDKDNLMEALNHGANGFISKPIDIDKFNEKLLEVIADLKSKLDKDKNHKEEKEMLYELAHYDELTKINNRFSFNQSLLKSINEKSPFALFFIDLDDFKPINDNYGHEAGDEILKWITTNISKIIRKDDVFARLGGDEFALIIKHIEDEDILKILAQKIIDATSIPFKYNQNVLQVSSSIGISQYPKDASDIDTIIKLADTAMYKSKKNQKSSFYLYSEAEASL